MRFSPFVKTVHEALNTRWERGTCCPLYSRRSPPRRDHEGGHLIILKVSIMQIRRSATSRLPRRYPFPLQRRYRIPFPPLVPEPLPREARPRKPFPVPPATKPLLARPTRVSTAASCGPAAAESGVYAGGACGVRAGGADVSGGVYDARVVPVRVGRAAKRDAHLVSGQCFCHLP